MHGPSLTCARLKEFAGHVLKLCDTANSVQKKAEQHCPFLVGRTSCQDVGDGSLAALSVLMDHVSPTKQGVQDGAHEPVSLKRRYSPFLIGVAGGTASGKTTVCNRIMQRLNDQCVALIHQDRYVQICDLGIC